MKLFRFNLTAKVNFKVAKLKTVKPKTFRLNLKNYFNLSDRWVWIILNVQYFLLHFF